MKETSGDTVLFNTLKIKVMKNWVVNYDGPLASLNLNISDMISERDDWIMVLGMDGSNEGVATKESEFGIVIKSSVSGEKKGFYVEQQLENRVVTGNWNN